MSEDVQTATGEDSRKKKRPSKRTLVTLIVGALVLCVLCGIVAQFVDTNDDAGTGSDERASTAAIAGAMQSEQEETPLRPSAAASETPTEAPAPTNTVGPTDTPGPTVTPSVTPEPSTTPQPSATPEPSATPTKDLSVRAGTYLVNTDIEPGLYRGDSYEERASMCYWARLSGLGGSLDEILANGNSIGPFYIEVLGSDVALETACSLTRLPTLPGPPATFPSTVRPGMYLVGIDIAPGRYRGVAGEGIFESCYWARLGSARGDLDSILANDNANGQFYIEVPGSDYALQTGCNLELVQ